MSKYYFKISLYSIICLMVVLLFGFILFVKDISSPLPEIGQLKPTQAIVILTGGTNRIYHGLNLALNKNFKDSQIFISGAGNKFLLRNHQEFQLLKKQYPNIENEISSRLSIGTLATTTEMNAVETSMWMELHHIKDITLVTSNYHLPRSLIEFSNFLKLDNIQVLPVRSTTLALERWWDFPGTFKIIFVEYCKYVVVFMLYQLNTFFDYIWGS